MSFAKTVLRLGAANIFLLAVQVVTISLLGLTTRPTDLGLFLLCQSSAQVFAAFAALRFDSAIAASRTRIELGGLLILSGAAMSVTAVLTFALVVGARLLHLFSLQAISTCDAVAIALLMLALALGQIGRFANIRSRELQRIERATYVRGAAILMLRGLFVALLYVSVQPVAHHQATLLIAAELVSGLAFAWLVRPRIERKTIARAMAPRVLRAVIGRNRKFPLLETPSAMVDSFANNAPIYLVTQFFGLASTAAFGLAFRALVVPFGQLALALTEVLQSYYGELLRRRAVDDFARLFHRTSLAGAVLGVMGCGLIFAGLEPIVVLLVGEKLRLFSRICVVISPWVAMTIIVNVNSRLVPLLKAQELKLVYDLSNLVAVASLCYIQVAFKLSLMPFLQVLTAAQVLTYLVYWALLAHAVRRVRLSGRRLNAA